MSGQAGWALAALAFTLLLESVTHADPARGERFFQRCYARHSVVTA